jgi:hypothetical protein
VNASEPRGILTLDVNDSLIASKGQLSAVGDNVREGATLKFILPKSKEMLEQGLLVLTHRNICIFICLRTTL